MYTATVIKDKEYRVMRSKSVRQVAWIIGSLMLLMAVAAFAHGGDSGRKIVVFREGASLAEQTTALAQSNSGELHHLWTVRAKAVQLPKVGAAAALEALRRHPKVEAVYEDHVISAQHVISFTPVGPPATESFPWGIERIGVPAVFDLLSSSGWSSPKVAILDSGIDISHPELAKSLAGGYNARAGENPADYQDYNGHGTHMAGIIAARWNGYGIIGAAQRPKLLAVKVLDHTGHGYLSDLINGLQWVLGTGARIVNMSLGFSEGSPLLEEVINQLHARGIVLVASAGNRCVGAQDDGGEDDGGEDDGGESGCTATADLLQGGVKYPARYPAVIAVAGIDVYNQITASSRSGPEVDIAAPAGSKLTGPILSTITGGAYAYGSGTSQAAAHVSGGLAVVLQLWPWFSATDLETLMYSTAVDLGYPGDQQGHGLIAVDGMVKKLFGLR